MVMITLRKVRLKQYENKLETEYELTLMNEKTVSILTYIMSPHQHVEA